MLILIIDRQNMTIEYSTIIQTQIKNENNQSD